MKSTKPGNYSRSGTPQGSHCDELLHSVWTSRCSHRSRGFDSHAVYDCVSDCRVGDAPMKGPLDADNLDLGSTDDGTPTLLPKTLYFLQQENYAIDDVVESHVVKRDSSDTAHIVFKIETYDFRRKDPRLDAVEDQIDIWVCDCADFTYRRFPDLTEDRRPSDYTPCVHIKEVSKVEKASADENQETL